MTDKIASLDGKDWVGKAALNYTMNNNFGIFVLGSKGNLFPNFDNIRENVCTLESGDASNGTVEPNLFNQFDLGVKIDQELYCVFITDFFNTIDQFDGDVGSTRAAALLITQTFGAEIDAALSVEGFRVNLKGIYQNG